MNSTEQYKQLKEKLEQKQQELSRAEGKLESLMEQMEKDFGCSSIKQAKTMLAKLEKQEEEAKQKFEEALEEFEEEWGDQLHD